MCTVKAHWYRPAYGYAAAAFCAAITAWGAASAPPTLGIMQALSQTDRDTQLPLERFAIDADHMGASSSLAQVSRPPRPAISRQSLQPLPRQAAQPSAPSRRISSYPQSLAAQPDHDTVRSITSHRNRGSHGYFHKIDDWKYWT
ncbi:hypothetical protein ABH945_006935 [Paraburkholderia sp. GAS333]|uniref:hypothetical protein n=1 Tax=Paraburkholderia sp. GAS333 TaxID=3156279 RepID=UPI003D1D4367